MLQRRRNRAPGEVHHGRGDGVAEDRELLGDHGGRAALAEPLTEPPARPAICLTSGGSSRRICSLVEFSHRGEHHAPYAQVQAHADGVRRDEDVVTRGGPIVEQLSLPRPASGGKLPYMTQARRPACRTTSRLS